MLELELLGPVVLRRTGQALPLAFKKTRALLAAALLWPLLDESTGRRNLRRELARLRELGAGDVVQVQCDLISACRLRAALAASSIRLVSASPLQQCRPYRRAQQFGVDVIPDGLGLDFTQRPPS